MIEAKGSRETAVSTTAGHDRYVLKNVEQRLRLPIAFAAFLLGLTTYLRSAVPLARSEESEDQSRQPPANEADTAAPADESVQIADLHEDSPPADFALVDSPAFSFTDVNEARHPIPVAQILKFRQPLAHDAAGEGISGAAQGAAAAILPFPNHKAHAKTSASGTASPDDGTIDDDNRPQPAKTDKNRAPRVSGPTVLNDVFGCAAVLITFADLLRNASDPDGDMLSVTNLKVSSGTLTQADGGWMFVPEAGALGDVLVSYDISDGHVSIQQVAHFSVSPTRPILGTSADDRLIGTACGETIDGGAGHNIIDARGGSDIITTGSGNDHIICGGGNDIVFAGAGADIIFGGAGKDTVFGGAGDDRIFGGSESDVLFGEDGIDTVEGGTGDDTLSGGAGADLVKGDDGNDILHGGDDDDRMEGGTGGDTILAEAGDDLVEGGTGDDVLYGGVGRDVVRGGAGGDRITVSLDTEDDTYEGGSDADTLDMSNAMQSVAVDLFLGWATGAEIGLNTISGFEKIVGGSGDDSLSGSSGDEEIIGGGGDDRLSGEGGKDNLQGGTGDDCIVASRDHADDTYDGGDGLDTLDLSFATMRVEVDLTTGRADGAEIGSDTFRNLEKVLGGQGDDLFIFGNTRTIVDGGAGVDTYVFNAFIASSDMPAVIHEILDYMIGDNIRIEQFDLFGHDASGDLFEQHYGDDTRHDGPIRFRHDRIADLQRTHIEADLNADDAYEISIMLHGNFAMSFNTHAG